jgi:hypothetical protein
MINLSQVNCCNKSPLVLVGDVAATTMIKNAIYIVGIQSVLEDF